MGALQRFEQRLESLVNGAFAKAFKAEVQPVEIANALQRECDNRAAIVSRDRTMVPNRFVVELAPTDHERLTVYADPLRTELADVVREHAKEQRYTLVGPVGVELEVSDDLDTGIFRVRSLAQGGPGPAAASEATQHGVPQDVRRSSPYLEVRGVRYPLTSALAVIGRGTEADVRVDDPGASRRHAQLTLRGTDVRVRDLGSTNGLIVDGERITEAALRDGSRLVIGDTTLVFRSG